MQASQRIRSTARDADHAELIDLQCCREVFDVGHGLERALALDKLRLAHARAVGGDDPQLMLHRLLGDVGRLMVRADQPVEEERGVPRGIAVLPHFQQPSGSRGDEFIRLWVWHTCPHGHP